MNIGILQMKSSTQNECLLDIILCLATAYVFLYPEDNAKVFIIL